MDCQIPGGNMKVVHKAITSLAKNCDELYIESHADHLAFVTIHPQKTTYAKFTFRSVFFLTYESEQCDPKTPNTCKLNIKSLMTVFKHRMDKKIEVCRITLGKDATKLVIKLKYKDDVNLVHSVNLIDFDAVNFPYEVDMPQSVVGCSGEFLNQILNNFQAADEDLSLEVYTDKTIIRNFNTDLEHEHNGVRSQIVLTKSEFQSYDIEEETSIVIGLKPLRAVLGFAEHFNLNVSYYFKYAGWPFIMLMKNPTFEVDLVLATGNPDAHGEECSTCPSKSSSLFPSANSEECSPEDNLSTHVCISKQPLEIEDKENEFAGNYSDSNRTPLTPIGSSNSNTPKTPNSLKDSDSQKSSGRTPKTPTGSQKSGGRTARTPSGSSRAPKKPRTPSVEINDQLAIASVNWEDDEDFDENAYTQTTKTVRQSDGSPEVKKARIFGRCFDPTFHASMIDFGDNLADNSDSDEEESTKK